MDEGQTSIEGLKMTDESSVVKDQSLEGGNSSVNVQAEPAEKMVPASRVNEIVQERIRDASAKSHERGYKEAEQKFSSMGGMTQQTDEQIRKLVSEAVKSNLTDLTQKSQEEEIQRRQTEVAQDFIGKLAAAKDKYPDLLDDKDTIIAMGDIAPYINQMSEVPAIVDHLRNNEMQMVGLLSMVKTPSLLKRALGKLEASIKMNQKEFPDVDEPSEQINPSSYQADNDSGSIEALKKQSWLRG